MAIRVTGMYSGLDTESIISELVSAKSVKKQKLVKAQTKLSWKQDAWKALNTKIYNFYTNVLDGMRYQGSYLKKTTKVSNSSAITVKTSDSAVDGTRTVKVNQLAKGAKLTGRSLETAGGVRFTGGADLATLRKFNGMDADTNLSGSFRVMGTQGEYLEFQVNENTTINDVVDMIKSTGLNCNFDADSQRIFVSSKNTGAVNNFYFMANDEGGMNALAALGLLSADDISKNPELSKWAGYGKDENKDAYEQAIKDEIASRLAEYEAANEKLNSDNDGLKASNESLKKSIEDILKSVADNAFMADEYAKKAGSPSLKDDINDLFGSLYDNMQAGKAGLATQKANLAEKQADFDAKQADFDAKKAKLEELQGAETQDAEAIAAAQQELDDAQAALNDAQTALNDAQTAYDDAKKPQDAYDSAKQNILDFINDVAYGPMVEKEEQVQAKDENGDPKVDEDGKPVYETVKVQVRSGGLDKKMEEAEANGGIGDELQGQIDALNKLYDDVINLEKNKTTITSNDATIEANEAKIKANEDYIAVPEEEGATSQLETDVRKEFANRVDSAQKSLDALEESGEYSKWLGASKVNGQDAEVIIDGALFTSMDNTFSVNGLTITANEVTDKEITITTSNDTDGVYDMIKNFFKEYNSLINEMSSLYNAEASTGYEPLTSEEKEALSESEIEEWEKKIKESLLRRDSTLSTVSSAMTSILLKGVNLNGEQWYLSDFGINTLGYFEAAENERNAYHIDGDADDDKTKANNNILKAMISNSPQAVMDFFTSLANNLYDELTEKMSSTTLSSAFTVYNDKQMKNEYNDYTDKIAREEEKLNALMDKWYSKFSKMEVAMSKLESRSSSLASILGGR